MSDGCLGVSDCLNIASKSHNMGLLGENSMFFAILYIQFWFVPVSVMAVLNQCHHSLSQLFTVQSVDKSELFAHSSLVKRGLSL